MKHAVLAIFVLSAGALPADDSDRFYDPDRVLEFVVEMPERDWNELCGQNRNLVASLVSPPPESPFRYFKGNVSIDGTRIDSVAIRKKGFLGSLDSRRPSLKLNLDKYVDGVKFCGIDNITLNNCKQDQALLSQWMTYRTYRKAGLPAPRLNLAKVTVNGDDLGIYANVEPVKPAFLRRQFGDNKGALFEGTLADFTEQGVIRFERKNKKDVAADREPLRRLTKILAADTLDLHALQQVIDVDEFMTYWALESLVGFWDGYCNNQNNFFVYASPDDGRLHFIPWGADVSFAKGFLSILFKRGTTQSVHARAQLPNVLYRHDEIRARYFVTLHRLLDTVWNEDDLLAETQRVETLVSPHLSESRRKKLQIAMIGVRSFIKLRRQEILDELAAGEPDPSDAAVSATATVTGSVTAKFAIDRDKLQSEQAIECSVESVRIHLNDRDPEQLDDVTLQVGPARGRPAPGSDQSARWMTFRGRKKDKTPVKLVLVVTPRSFRDDNHYPIQIQGSLTEGEGFSFFNPPVERPTGGTLVFDAAPDSQDGRVIGSATMQLFDVSWGQ